jgi:hypothetical protein
MILGGIFIIGFFIISGTPLIASEFVNGILIFSLVFFLLMGIVSITFGVTNMIKLFGDSKKA